MKSTPSSSSFSNEGCQCGLERITSKIINGNRVDYGRYPWFVRLTNCGGGLITDKHILTSAHCVSGKNEEETLEKRKNMRVVLGVFKETEFKKFPSLEVQEYIVHEGYRDELYYNDIAIIELKERIEFKDGLCPICLPNFEETDNLFVYGMGRQLKLGRLMKAFFMHEIELDRMSADDCEDFFHDKFWFDKTLTLCTTNKERNHVVCHGDSGSPASTRRDGRVYFMGVTSFSHPDCSVNHEVYPNGFENVFKHIDWIRKKTTNGFYCQGEHTPFEPGLLSNNIPIQVV